MYSTRIRETGTSVRKMFDEFIANKDMRKMTCSFEHRLIVVDEDKNPYEFEEICRLLDEGKEMPGAKRVASTFVIKAERQFGSIAVVVGKEVSYRPIPRVIFRTKYYSDEMSSENFMNFVFDTVSNYEVCMNE